MAGKKSTGRTIIEDILKAQLEASGLGFFTREFRFHPVRRWRADFAFEEQRVLIEVHGGTYSGGRHVQGKGYAEDREKANTAQESGWMMLEFDTNHVKKGHAIECICRILSSKTGQEFSPTYPGGIQPSSTSRSPKKSGRPSARKKRLSRSKKLDGSSTGSLLRSLCRDCRRKVSECVCESPRKSVPGNAKRSTGRNRSKVE